VVDVADIPDGLAEITTLRISGLERWFQMINQMMMRAAGGGRSHEGGRAVRRRAKVTRIAYPLALTTCVTGIAGARDKGWEEVSLDK